MRTKKTTKTTADVLDRAIGVLERRGWCRNEAVDGEGRVCVGEALARGVRSVTRNEATRHSLGNAVRIEVSLELNDRYNISSISGWNDRIAKSRRQVISLLRRVAKRLRAKS